MGPECEHATTPLLAVNLLIFHARYLGATPRGTDPIYYDVYVHPQRIDIDGYARLVKELSVAEGVYLRDLPSCKRTNVCIPVRTLCRTFTDLVHPHLRSIRSVGSSTVHVTDGDLRHELKPGTFVSVPYSLVNRDASIYSDPDKFDPGRFLELDPSSGKLTARYGRLKPWGSGSAMCKGRIFAEKEIVTLAVAIITMWDVGPADGAWKLPGKVPGTGVRKPTNDIRVVITRRI